MVASNGYQIVDYTCKEHLRKITLHGNVPTVAGMEISVEDGVGTAACLTHQIGIVLDGHYLPQRLVQPLHPQCRACRLDNCDTMRQD